MTTFLTFKLLWSFLKHVRKKRRFQFLGLIILMVFASFAEIVSIGSVLPFLGVLVAPEQVYNNDSLQIAINLFGFKSPDDLILPLTVIFIGAVLFAGITRLVLVWVITRLSFAIGADISVKVYSTTLYQPYSFHSAKNSSEIINGVFNKTNIVISSFIVPTITLISSTIMLVTILIALIIIEPIIALSTVGGFGLIYLLVVGMTRKQLINNGQKVADETTKAIKTLQEGLGGIREVLINRTQEVFCQIYRSSDLKLRRAQGTTLLISSFPRYGIETLGMLLIAVIAYSMTKFGSIASTIPILGALALGAQRILPILQQAYVSWTNILGDRASLEDILDLLDNKVQYTQIKDNKSEVNFKKNIKLKNVNFKYDSSSSKILKKVNLTILKGSKVGFVGQTGSGKSTLLDIMMGLHLPSSGSLLIDDRKINEMNLTNWQMHISHVPQTIYLSDNSIAENIAFGVPKDKIDMDQVKEAASNAYISKTINSWSDGYRTLVGERGVRLSGGQLQRIGIARALYNKASLIIFDEATSSLDYKTEKAVMDSINKLGDDITVLIIAHRRSTLKNCDKIVEISNGEVFEI